MKKGMWILVAIGAAGTAVYFGFKWLESLFQIKALAEENTDLRYENNNVVQEKNSLKQQNTIIVQENKELKKRISELPVQPEPPPQTA